MTLEKPDSGKDGIDRLVEWYETRLSNYEAEILRLTRENQLLAKTLDDIRQREEMIRRAERSLSNGK